MNTLKIVLKIKMKDFFPESLGQKCGCTLYIGVHYTWQNIVRCGVLHLSFFT